MKAIILFALIAFAMARHFRKVEIPVIDLTDDEFKNDEFKVNGKEVGKDILTILKDIFTNDEFSKAGRDVVAILKDIFLHNDELRRHVNGVAVAGDVINGVKTAGEILGDIFGNDQLSKAGRDVVAILKDIFLHNDELKRHVNGMAIAGDVIGGVKTAGEILGDIFGNDELSKAGRDVVAILKDIFLHNDEFSKAGRDIVAILKDIFLHNDELRRHVNGVAVAGDVINGVKTAGEILGDIFGNDQLSKAGRDVVAILKDIFLHNDEFSKAGRDVVAILKDIFLHNDELKRHVNGMAIAGDVIGGVKTAGEILGDIFGNDELSKAGRDVVAILKDIFLHNDELSKAGRDIVAILKDIFLH